MIKPPFAQKCCGLFCGNVFKQHTAVADGQDNVVAHIRAAGFADQNRTVVFTVQAQYAPKPERLVAGDAAQFDMFGQIGRAAVERIAIRAAEYGGFQPKRVPARPWKPIWPRWRNRGWTRAWWSAIRSPALTCRCEWATTC